MVEGTIELAILSTTDEIWPKMLKAHYRVEVEWLICLFIVTMKFRGSAMYLHKVVCVSFIVLFCLFF